MGWGTREEIEFLKGLGSHCSSMGNARLVSRRTLLLRYRRSMALRKDWGRIDREVVESYLNMELNGGCHETSDTPGN